MSFSRALWPGLFVFVLALSGIGLYLFSGAPVRYEVRVIPAEESLSGLPLRVVYIFPESVSELPARSRPAVIAVPPYSIAPEAMEILCVELARRGAACAIPDFFGKTREESRQRMGRDALEIMVRDMLSIAHDLARRHPWLDPERFGICGHSVGGRVAIETAMAAPAFRSCAPIGMEFGFGEKIPRNLLFIAGLYDEIHYPDSLLENLRRHGVDPEPRLNTLYGSHEEGTARQLVIIPTTDHFIETFDYWLISELLDWFALSLDEPALSGGTLREWWRRVSAFLFTLAAAGLWGVLMGRLSLRMVDRFAGRTPPWLLNRALALPLLVPMAALMVAGDAASGLRLAAAYLLVALPLAQEAVNHLARGALRHPGRSPFRALRSALMVALALGAATLMSFVIVCVNHFVRWPEFIPWIPVFFANMALLFPLQVWGRSIPMLFSETITGLSPGAGWFVLVGVVLLLPGQLMRFFDRIAGELMASLQSRLRPLEREKAEEIKGTSQEAVEEQGSRSAHLSWLKITILLVLALVLGFLVYRRIAEGMLTIETAWFALWSILRFAVLPFILAWLIVRTRRFRVLSHLD